MEDTDILIPASAENRQGKDETWQLIADIFRKKELKLKSNKRSAPKVRKFIEKDYLGFVAAGCMDSFEFGNIKMKIEFGSQYAQHDKKSSQDPLMKCFSHQQIGENRCEERFAAEYQGGMGWRSVFLCYILNDKSHDGTYQN